MAIVKASYTRSKAGARATLQYITNRPGKDGESLSRALFGYDGLMEWEQAHRMVDEAEEGIIFYRLVISPDPEREDQRKNLNLWDLTTQTMLHLEERLQQEVRFVATEHDDHSPNRHVHVLALIAGRLNTRDLAALRRASTEAALFQRRERDLAAEQQSRGQLAQVSKASSPRRGERKRSKSAPFKAHSPRWQPRTGKAALSHQTCPRCGSQLGPRQAVCGSCGLKLAREQGRGVSWER